MKAFKYGIFFYFIAQLILQATAAFAAEPNTPFTYDKDSNNWQESKKIQGMLKADEVKNSFPEKQWWLKFNDPILNCYIDQALQVNQDIKIALARIEEANQQANIVFGREFPQVNIRDVYFRVKGSQNFLFPNVGQSNISSSSFLAGSTQNIFILPLIAQYELDLFRKNRSKTKAARKAVEISKFDYDTVNINIASNVATTYFNLLQADKLLKLQCELLQNQEKSLELRQSRYNEGLISLDDVLANQEAISQVKSNIADIQRLQGTLVHQLNILMGKPPTTEQELIRNNLDQICISKEINIGNPSQLITRRPDILASESQVEQAGINISVARKELLPSFSIIGSFGYSSSSLEKFFNWSSNTSAIGSSITQDLFTGGSKIANLKLNKAIYKETIEGYHKTILNAFKEVEDALSTLNSNILRYTQAEEDVINSKHQFLLVNNRYLEGANSSIDVLNSEQQLINFRQNLTQRKSEILIDNISLYKALGGGF